MALDADLFRFELQHFCEHYLYRLCRIRPTANQRQQLEAACERLCLRLQQEPQVLCHRDYHARNLLIQDGHRLTIIDHQDARLGPDTYDLASLIHDPYVSLPTSLAEELTHRFRAARPQQEQAGVFAERLDAMAAQRLLKAAGTYAAQKVLRDSDVYLPYLPLALQRASAALARHPRHQDLLTALQAMSDRFRPEPAP